MALNGYIKLHRQLIEWEWYNDRKVKEVFIHLLLLVSFKDGNWRGQGIKKGQLVTSYKTLSKDLGYTLQELRTVFKKLKSTNEVNTIATGRNLIVTLVNFGTYQSDERIEQHDSNTITTGLQHDSNTESTSKQQHRKNVNKDKNVKNVNNVNNKDKSLVPLFIEIAEYYKSTTGQNILIGKTDSLIIRSDKFKKISERLKNGATVEDCKAVIKLKNDEWKNDKKMSKNINIPTLFRASNFEKYLDAVNNSSTSIITKENNFPYQLPEFESKEARQSYFLARYSIYKESGQLDEYKANTEYRQRAIYQKDAERLCFELELEMPKLLEIEFNYKPL